VWENGQILKQGQSSRPRKSPTTNSLPSHTPKTRDKDIGNGTSSKMGKFGGMDSVLDEIPMSVPSGEMDLSQDDDMMPWLNYPIDESLQHEYCSEFLPELSGVTVNELSAQNNLASIDKSSSCNMVYRDCHTDFVNDGLSLRHGDVSKVSSVVGVEATRPRNSSFPLYPSSSQQCQTSLPSLRSRVSDVTGNNMSTVMHHAVCGDSTRVASAAGGFPSIKMQKKDPMPPSNNPNLMNFSHFSRPAALVKANLENIGLMATSGLSSMERMASKEKGSAASSENPPESTLINSSSGLRKESSSHCQPVAVPLKVDLKSLGEKPIEEPIATEQSEAVCQGDASKNDKSFNQVRGESATKGLPDGEKPIEPVVASSSVCSGNSVERASDDPTHSLKRKCRDTEESECHSEVSLCIGITSFQFPYFICFLHLPRKHYHVQDVEEESMGTKKAAPARGGVGSKRSRAAEVHNLSERVSNTIQD
jgi:phytochrome-interacting factor 3